MDVRNTALEILAKVGRCEGYIHGNHSIEEWEEKEFFELTAMDALWDEHTYKFETGKLVLSNWVTADGIDDIHIRHSRKLVYQNKRYSDGDPVVRIYEEGAWEEELKELHNSLFSE